MSKENKFKNGDVVFAYTQKGCSSGFKVFKGKVIGVVQREYSDIAYSVKETQSKLLRIFHEQQLHNTEQDMYISYFENEAIAVDSLWAMKDILNKISLNQESVSIKLFKVNKMHDEITQIRKEVIAMGMVYTLTMAAQILWAILK